jgi:hypothetical protein
MITQKTPGRKRLSDPKMEIRIYIETSYVNGAGGEEAAKVIASGAIKAVAEKLKKKR